MIYEIGDTAHVTAQFFNLSKQPADPSLVQVTITDPSGVVTGPFATTRTGVGAYYYDQPILLAGPNPYYFLKFTGTGVNAAVLEYSLTVQELIAGQANPQLINLTTLALVTGELSIGTPGIATSSTGNQISKMITANGLWWLHQTGRGPSDGSIPSGSPFVSPQTYNEWYDGSGSDTQFVRNWPVTAVTSITANGTTFPQSTDINTPGWFIDSGGACIVLRGGNASTFAGRWGSLGGYSRAGFGCGYQFFEGNQNVNIQYTAGFSAVPFDLQRASTEMVAMTFQNLKHIGRKSDAMASAGGSTSYAYEWVYPPTVERVLNYYKRRAVV